MALRLVITLFASAPYIRRGVGGNMDMIMRSGRPLTCPCRHQKLWYILWKSNLTRWLSSMTAEPAGQVEE